MEIWLFTNTTNSRGDATSHLTPKPRYLRMRLRCRLLAPSERPLRICFISPYPPEKEGVADYLTLLVKTLVTRDPRIDITVISQADNSVSYSSERIGQHLRII